MARLLHLSDLHLSPGAPEQRDILESLAVALAEERRGGPFELVCVTGDVFDSATLPPDSVIPAFVRLLDAVHAALGGAVPTVIVPGNHDCRRSGLFLPYDTSLFQALRGAVGDHVFVHGGGSPFLAEVVPRELHRLPLWIVAYDSNYVPGGAICAGGVLRQEDILRAAAIVDSHHADWPVLFLLHHHLIPTPLTDLGPVDAHGAPRPVRWLLQHAAPRALSHADHEELFMTALGAGTALSILHAMARPVLVLHGHKHYATSRLVTATQPRQGDVLVVSAGSAGTAQRWYETPHPETARLWPSFNVIELDGDRLSVDTIAFSWRAGARASSRRPMVRARREGARWVPLPVLAAAREPGPSLVENRARIELSPSRRHGRARWDCQITRHVRFEDGDASARYVETLDGPPRARLLRAGRRTELPSQLLLEPERPTRFVLEGGAARTVAEEAAIAGRRATPYGRVALMNRYRAAHARLDLTGLGDRVRTAFGSATDLATGLSRPVPVATDAAADRARLDLYDCPPRTLLRIFWLLEDARHPAGTGMVPAPEEHAFGAPHPDAMRCRPNERCGGGP